MSRRRAVPAAGFFSGTRKPILVVSLAAIAIRIVMMVSVSDTFLWNGIWSDADTYHQWARRIAGTGEWLGDSPFFMSPLYAYFLASVYSLFGESLLAVRLIQSIAGTGTAVLVFLIGERLFSRKAGFYGGLLAALYGPLLLSPLLLLVETLKVFLITLTLWAALNASERKRLWSWGACGAVLGLAALCRPTDLLILPVLTVWILFIREEKDGRLPRLAAVVGGVILIIAPVTVRNYTVSGDFVLITSNGGLNFFLGNNPDAVGVYYNVARLDLENDPDGRRYLEAETGRALDHSEASSIWMAKALRFVSDDPAAFLSLLGRKALLFLHHKEISQVGYNYRFVAEFAAPVLKAAPGFLLAGSLAFIGLVLSWKRRRDLFLAYGFLAAEILSVVLFFMTDRFRLSAIPFLLLFAGFAVHELIGWIRARDFTRLGRGLIPVVVIVPVMTVLNVDIPDDYSIEWEYVGLQRYESKDYRGALQAFQESGRYKDSFHLRNNIGNVYLALGQTDAALEQFLAGRNMNRAQPVSTFSAGTAYASRQEWGPALAAFDEAIAINPRFAPAHLNKGLVLYYLQRFDEALSSLRTYVSLEKDRSKLTSVYGDIRNLEQLIRQRDESPQDVSP